MGDVIPLFQAIPERHIDRRISRLHRRFGTSFFTLAQASDALHISEDAAWNLLFFDPGLADGRYRVNIENAGFRLHPIPPHKAATEYWKSRYVPVIRDNLPVDFTAEDFSRLTGVPFASANFILSLLVQSGTLEIGTVDNSAPGGPEYRLARKRRRVVRLDQMSYA